MGQVSGISNANNINKNIIKRNSEKSSKPEQQPVKRDGSNESKADSIIDIHAVRENIAT